MKKLLNTLYQIIIIISFAFILTFIVTSLSSCTSPQITNHESTTDIQSGGRTSQNKSEVEENFDKNGNLTSRKTTVYNYDHKYFYKSYSKTETESEEKGWRYYLECAVIIITCGAAFFLSVKFRVWKLFTGNV